ncbi:MAG: NAD-dependent epimerase/dehydratase family protein [Deltaproteobacteria bacterium]|nr:NAD-dependent epimerase/dehydratase family protein [Deltaproteobacteria bacterium]
MNSLQDASQPILVTGGAGEIGSRLVRHLTDAGRHVRVLVLPNDPGLGRLEGMERVELRVGDITDPATLVGVFDGVGTVYHLAAVLLVEDENLFRKVNVQGARNVAEAAAAASVRHLIHISSASVVYPNTTPYSRSKRAGEEAVRRVVRRHDAVGAGSEMKLTIARPTLVYDGEGGLEFALFLRHLERFPWVPMVGAGDALKNPVYVDDLVRGLFALAGQAITYGKTYNLSGGEVLSMRDLARLLLAYRGLEKPLVAIPDPLCHLAGRVLGKLLRRPLLLGHTLAGLTQDAALSPDLACQDLGYAPRGIRAGLKMSPTPEVNP